jgi:CBS domain containing-hemolysin-like protein
MGALGLRHNGSARAAIEAAITEDESEGGTLSAEERAMLRAVLKLGEMRVEDVMVPRADIEALELDSTVAEAIAIFRDSGHSRMPVYREDLDDPVGMVHIRDLMTWVADRAMHRPADEAPGPPSFDFSGLDLSQGLKAAGLVRPVLFVPPSMPAQMLMKRMQSSRTQMALVIDEYGGTDGLVSLEDLVEIIVGEIEDEHDLDEEPNVMRVADGVFIADGRTSIDDARDVIGPDFRVATSAEDLDTIGGLIIAATGRIPLKGETVEAVDGFEFEVLEADPRRIRRVRIRDKATAQPIPRPKRAAAG